MPDNIKYRSFTAIYDKPTSSLIAPLNILPLLMADKTSRNIQVKVNALWDTGATATCIKPALFEHLDMRLFDSTNYTLLAGVGGTIAAKATLISLFLTSAFEIAFCPVYVADFPGNADMLIGMDIINKGDFVVCNTDAKTSFSFVMPPFPDRIDFTKKAIILNK